MWTRTGFKMEMGGGNLVDGERGVKEKGGGGARQKQTVFPGSYNLHKKRILLYCLYK